MAILAREYQVFYDDLFYYLANSLGNDVTGK
jgi:hypothetical protein